MRLCLKMKIKFVLNGQTITINKNPSEKLSVFLREKKLAGYKEGCLNHSCTACTVLLDDVPVQSCLTSLAQCDNCKITTLDEFKKTEEFADIKKGFEQAKVRMCGFCNAGKVFIANEIIMYRTKAFSIYLSTPFILLWQMGNPRSAKAKVHLSM